MTVTDPNGLFEKLSQLQAQKSVKKSRKDALKHMVSEAKKRVNLQPKVQDFLDRLQERCHEKSVGLYEGLLTAILQDVMCTDKKVGLTLKTSRGLPSLDIDIVNESGDKEDILDGSGGSLVNILSAGLRVIALARSNAYPFLVLDEPDCWVKPSLVPQFARVIGQIAKDLNIQILIISHHDIESFQEVSTQVALEKQDGILKAERVNPALETEWDNAQSGIKEIRLINLMSHENTSIPLAPGVTCLTGMNDIGKSVVLTGLRALFYGNVGDFAIRHKTDHFKVEAVFHDNTILSMERYLKKSPKQRWRFYVPGQADPVQDGSPKDGAPDWVETIAKVARIDDMDVAFAHQKKPVFLLDESPSRRASILALGRETMHLQKLIAKNKEKNLIDNRLIREGEKEGDVITRELLCLETLDSKVDTWLQLKYKLKCFEEERQILEVLNQKISRLEKTMEIVSWELPKNNPDAPTLEERDRLEDLLKRWHWCQQVAAIESPSISCKAPVLEEQDVLVGAIKASLQYEKIKDLIVPARLTPPVIETHLEEFSEKINRLTRLTGINSVNEEGLKIKIKEPTLEGVDQLLEWGRRLSRINKVLVLERLLNDQEKKDSPHWNETDGLAMKISVLKELLEKVNEGPEQLRALEKEKNQLVQQKNQLIEDMGGVCPTCGSEWSKEHESH